MDEIVVHILGHKDDKRVPKLKKSIQYYLDGAKDNVIKNKTKSQEKNKNPKDKNDTIESATVIDLKKPLESECLNSQVLILVYKIYIYFFSLKGFILKIYCVMY